MENKWKYGGYQLMKKALGLSIPLSWGVGMLRLLKINNLTLHLGITPYKPMSKKVPALPFQVQQILKSQCPKRAPTWAHGETMEC